MKHRLLLSLSLTALLLMATAFSAMGKLYEVGGRTVNVLGYVSQGIQYSTVSDADDLHEVEKGFNQALSTVFLELDYNVNTDLQFYASGKMVADWIYDLKSDDGSWSKKEFSKSRSAMQYDDEWWQIFHEAHVTWAPGNFLFRFGKQIVSWGEMDLMQVMDQINPVDGRRGFSDLEFETTVIPIPLLRAEWWPDLSNVDSFLTELGIQFILNPNAEFIPDMGMSTVNASDGIWSANLVADGLRLELNGISEEPDEWDPDEWEFGVRIQAMMGLTIMTVNGFYGRANSSVEMLNLADPIGPLATQNEMYWAGAPVDPVLDTEGNFRYDLNLVGYYPRQKFLGVTLTTEIPQWTVSALGGSSPVIRIEAKYEIDKVFTENGVAPLIDPNTGALIDNGFIESDTIETGIGFDWKLKWNLINPKGYLDTSFQFWYTKILDYPKELDWVNAGGAAQVHIMDILDQDNYMFSAYIQTLYLNAKLVPYVAYLFDISNDAHLFLAGATYTRNNNWAFGLDYAFHEGNDTSQSLDAFEKKDYISFKVKYIFQ
jgi:Protein of unknown function (DUF1302)